MNKYMSFRILLVNTEFKSFGGGLSKMSLFIVSKLSFVLPNAFFNDAISKITQPADLLFNYSIIFKTKNL